MEFLLIWNDKQSRRWQCVADGRTVNFNSLKELRPWPYTRTAGFVFQPASSWCHIAIIRLHCTASLLGLINWWSRSYCGRRLIDAYDLIWFDLKRAVGSFGVINWLPSRGADLESMNLSWALAESNFIITIIIIIITIISERERERERERKRIDSSTPTTRSPYFVYLILHQSSSKSQGFFGR